MCQSGVTCLPADCSLNVSCSHHDIAFEVKQQSSTFSNIKFTNKIRASVNIYSLCPHHFILCWQKINETYLYIHIWQRLFDLDMLRSLLYMWKCSFEHFSLLKSHQSLILEFYFTAYYCKIHEAQVRLKRIIQLNCINFY